MLGAVGTASLCYAIAGVLKHTDSNIDTTVRLISSGRIPLFSREPSSPKLSYLFLTHIE